MIASDSMPVPRKPMSDGGSDRARLMNSPELIERLANELRLRSDPHLPQQFYTEQVKRQLAGRIAVSGATAREHAPRPGQAQLQSASVFRAWAMPEH